MKERFIKWFIGFWAVFCVAVVSAIVYVAIHFIKKFW